MKKDYKSLKPDHAILATDVVFFKLENSLLKVLLIKPKNDHYKDSWAAPGGLVKGFESPDEAAVRFSHQFIDVEKYHLEQLYTFGDPNRDLSGRVVSVAYLSLVPPTTQSKTTDQYPVATWFPVKDLPNLAYDHQEVIEKAVKRLQGKLTYTNIIKFLMPAEFTLTELQLAYEIILNNSLDKRNFRKKIKSLGFVTPLSKMKQGLAHRPAKLYTFAQEDLQAIQVL